MPLPPIAGELLRFALVGGIGFLVDAASVAGLALGLGLDPYSARVGSYLLAATTTWMLNRSYTFRHASGRHPLAEWLHFLAANTLGGAINYATYASWVAWQGGSAGALVVGVALGSIAGMGVNFAVAKWWVFRPAAEGATPAE